MLFVQTACKKSINPVIGKKTDVKNFDIKSVSFIENVSQLIKPGDRTIHRYIIL